MDIIRLGDRLSGYSRSASRSTHYKNDEFLAQQVFNPLPDPEEITSWFIASKPADETHAYKNILSTDIHPLGQYEVKLIDKFLNPQRPVLVIIGPMGSGKTTVKNYIALNLVKNREHCKACGQLSNRLIAHINFDEHSYLNDLSGSTLSNKFYSILCDELQSRVKHGIQLSEEEELVKFWDYELGRYLNHHSSSLAFRHIASLIKPTREQPLTDDDLAERRKIRKQIEKNKEHFLDYLIRLWSYLLKFQFCGQSGCAYVILDNVDRAHAVVQRKLLDIIHTHAQMKGPTFVIFLRPETFDHMGLGTGIIDYEEHNGPRVLDVIKRRLNQFCITPEKFYAPGRGLSDEQFEIIRNFLARANKEILADKYQNFEHFIENSCGRSIRNGLLLMQSMFFASQADMTNPNISVRELIRICIRGGEEQLHWSPTYHINHLFRIANHNEDSLLVKPRILRYLGRHVKGKRRLNEVVNTLLGFYYDEETVISALNDLMQISSQLVRSNGFNQYEEDALRKYPANTIMLTDVGRGYSNYLMTNLDYLQEVMLDTYVDGDNFPQEIGYGYLVEKFNLLHTFLNEMRRIDVQETENFVDHWSEQGYKEAFGDHLLTLDIIQTIYQPVIGILDAEKHDRFEVDELIDYFRSLVLQVEEDNRRILGVEIKSVISARQK